MATSSECPFKYADVTCIHGKRYRRVEQMPETLLPDDMPEDKLMYIGECFRCAKVTYNNSPTWKFEVDRCSQYWSG